MTFEELQAAVHANSRAKGFYDDDDIIEALPTTEQYVALRRRLILARLAMIGSEVGEAVDAVRATDVNVPKFSVRVDDRDLTGTEQGSELADIVIRTMDLAEYMGIDLATEIEAKHAFNLTRPQRHGKLA
jgi:NTP pyrophosphatase (non-canonical NTP hydrolase)